MYEPTPLEREILTDIERRTGYAFRKLGAIAVCDAVAMKAILPIATEWLGRVEDPNHRRALFDIFGGVHARPDVDQLIAWWRGDEESLTHSFLGQILARKVKTDRQAAALWRAVQEVPRRLFHIQLLCRLARFPSVAGAVRDALYAELTTKPLGVSELQAIRRVADPRIAEWFRKSDEAKRPSGPEPKLKLVGGSPEGMLETDSAECDVDEIGDVLRGLRDRHHLDSRNVGFSRALRSRLDREEWVGAPVISGIWGAGTLWFRKEDVDVVQVVLTKASM